MPDPITRLNAALEGRYRIEGELGEGGMATVYLAEDLKHERKVALKVLKPELAAVVGAERFLAEIKTTANLQHPHILPLHDSGEADGFLYYVMPHIEGESLRDRLQREKQLPVEESVKIASDVAEALHSAHKQGVIHRDIKPANILMSEGRPLVADFGIALAVSAAGGGRLTETGLSMGTPFYMSPEQASADREPNPASDVYSLGCVLYEMLVGEPPYTGGSAQAVLAKILIGDAPTPTATRPAIPANVDGAIRKALEKLPADRFNSTADFASALSDSRFRYGELEPMVAGRGGAWRSTAIGLAVLSAILAGVAGWALQRPGSQPRPPIRFEVPLAGASRGDLVSGLALSPDGSRLAFVGTSAEGGPQLWLRSMDQLEAQPIRGTEGASRPSFSPDGTSVAFSVGILSGAGIKRTSLESGVTSTVAEPVEISGFTQLDWGSDGMIYFNDVSGLLSRVAASGGTVERLPVGGRGVDVLPNGQGLISTQAGEVVAISREGESVTVLFPALGVRYLASGHLVYVTENRTLMAVPFDPRRSEVTGLAVALLEGVSVNAGGKAEFTLSQTGTLAFYPDADRLSELVKVRRTGEVEVIHPAQTEPLLSLALSPDETRIAVSIGTEKNRVGAAVPQDIWIKRLDGGQLTRLTLGGSKNLRPSWNPDGQHVTFISDRGGGHDVWTMRADGTGAATLVEDVDRPLYGIAWSSDGTWMLSQAGAAGARDITALRPGLDDEPTLLLGDEVDEFSPALSPDGRWLAYVSSESGGPEIFVRPFPNVADGKWQVSQGGAVEPAWAHSGRELFYRSLSLQRMIAVPVETSSGFAFGQGSELFPTADYHSSGGAVATYSVGRDDQHFYMIRSVADAEQSSATVVLNFMEEVKRLAPN